MISELGTRIREPMLNNKSEERGDVIYRIVNSAPGGERTTAKRAVTTKSITQREGEEDGNKIHLTVRRAAEQLTPTARLVEVCLRFGVPMQVPGQQIASELPLSFRPGSITLITGPSGSGKSQMLGAIAGRFPTSRLVNNVQFPLDVSIIDAVAPTRPISEALGLLTACGLGEPMLWIRRFTQLSDGERFRAMLARTISLHRRSIGERPSVTMTPPLLCDEFGSLLHRRLAKAIAFNIRKLITRERFALVVATSLDDLEQDLRPDLIVRLGGCEPVVEERKGIDKKHLISFARRLRIERGTIRDYAGFSAMHYRHWGQLGFIDKVFVMRDGVGGEAVGVVVYGRPLLELAHRNRATCGRFIRRPKLLNRELRVLKRLVIHPDIRGCGLGHWLVRRTLPLVGTRFVECLAAMGVVNPVFEKAGMRKIGVCPSPAGRADAVAQLKEAGADPMSADFVSQVCRRPTIRRLVSKSVGGWYRSLGREERINKQSPTTLAQTFRQMVGSEPVYFIWSKDEKGWSLINRGQEEMNVKNLV